MGEQADLQYLLTSRPADQLSPLQWSQAQRAYWGVEAGLHQRLDVSADEDRSRVRNRNACWTLSIFRRIAISLFMHWRQHHPKQAHASLADFHEEMSLEHHRRAFALLNSKQSAALESS